MPTESAQRALSILRDGSHFQWHVIPLFIFDLLQILMYGVFLGWLQRIIYWTCQIFV